ncbi:hypothetical protein Calag_1574 [Caldisphaera lagunensis DSM 15908]|uniref:Uncharacterized protein n=1 Tax=Caldisphaera lagunensis (strain DSM 15908 / JCM 11604 / ANMR 0165 / IC-154) TaxID=1056495 RepID=L0ADR0_CALLD|nr:hypothetical protein [Caldisphaera lagunensis]AFZ71272.1 hypothetical protein Calag_1574 [Caldisphaera lagunensis DSM 15908]
MSEDNQNNEEKKQEKTYTIRGLNEDLYESFTKAAKEMGTTVGELMNQAMSQFLVTLEAGKDVGKKISEKASKASSTLVKGPFDAFKQLLSYIGEFDIVSNITELTVTKQDLENSEKPIVFSNIKKLVFSPDIDINTFNTKVRSIKVVDEVVVPSTLPLIPVAKKCQLVKKITQLKQ